MRRQPDAVAGEVEGVAVLDHAPSGDGEQDWRSASRADGECGLAGGGKVHVVTAAGLQALAQDGREEALDRAMEEGVGRVGERPVAGDLDRMALAGADAAAVRGEFESLLVVAGDKGTQFLLARGVARPGECVEDGTDRSPAFGIEDETGLVRRMPQPASRLERRTSLRRPVPRR